MDYIIDNKDDFIVINSLVYKYEDLDMFQMDDIDDIILPFDINDLINSIYHSYQSKKDIYNQFIVDIKRTSIYYHDFNKKINHCQLLKLLSHKKNLDRILICFTQSVYFWPYKIISHKYCKDDIHLGEIPNNKTSYIKYINDNNIILYKELRLFKVDKNGNDKTLKKLKIEIHISFDISFNTSVLLIY